MARREQSLSSSMLSSAGYDEETQSMDVTFRNGKTYSFPNVPLDIYETLISSSSPGRFYHDSIKGIFG
jgi:hypothetical protein